MFKFIHAADFHLDSAFGALPARQAAARRRESRELVFRLADYVNDNEIGLVLLAGDLFDSGSAFRETGEQLAAALGQMRARVLIAPGNHDWYGPGSPWQTVDWPENVTVFREHTLTAAELPEWNLVVHGAAFTGPEQTAGFLTGFTAPADGRVHIGLLHGELDPSEARYDPIRREEAAASGLAYLALGHIHKRTEPQTFGGTLCAWPGCIEGRGFDEQGEKGFYQGTVDGAGRVSLTFVPFARRRYEILEVDVTGQAPRAAVEAALPADTARHLYRVLLTGSPAAPVSPERVRSALADRFYALQVRDKTTARQELWDKCGEDSLRGLFLQQLRAACGDDPQSRRLMEQAAVFGLAAIDDREV